MPTTIQLGHNTGDDYTGGLTVVELFSGQPTTNQGTGASGLELTSWNTGDYRHGLLRWNSAPSLGGTVYVTAADFEWYISASSGAQPFIFYKCLRAANPSTATWNTYDGSNSWGTAGALNATDIDIANGMTVSGWAAATSKNITAEWFRQLVQDFLNGVVTEIVLVANRKPYNAGDGGGNYYANLYQPSGSSTQGPRINVTYIMAPDSASPSSDVTTTKWTTTGGNYYGEVDESTVNTADYVTSPDITDDTGSSPLVLGLNGTSDNGDVLVQISSECVTTEAWQRVLLLDSGGTAQATGDWFAPPIDAYTHNLVLAPAADVVQVKIEKRLTRPVPAYYTALTSAEWSPLPDSTFENSPAWWTQSTLGSDVGGSGQEYIYSAWNGFVVNTVGCYYDSRFHWGTFIMFVGSGGHDNWRGTGVVAYGPLDNYSEAPKWHTLIDHIVPGPTGSARSGSTPTSHHIYQSQHFDAATNRVIGITTPGYSSAGASSNASNALDCYTNTWSALADASNVGSEAGVNAVSCNDGTYIWMLPTGNGYSLNRVTISNDARSTYTKDFPETRAGLAAGLHPTASVMAWSDGTTVWAFDLRDPTTNVRYTPTVTGTAPGSTNGLSLSWNTTNSRFECRTSASNKTVYHLTPGADPYSGGDDWAWSSTTPGSGTTPVAEAAGSGGQYGKAQWLNGVVPGMVYAPDPTAPIYIYKP